MTEADEKEFEALIPAIEAMLDLMEEKKALEREIEIPVSYTHLTLPTIYSV